jgi:hypothetical protein
VLNFTILSIYGSIALVDLGRFFSFLIHTQSVRILGRGISPSQIRYLHTEEHKQNKRTQTSTPRVGFEPTIAVFERTKTVHTLDRLPAVAQAVSRWLPTAAARVRVRAACGVYGGQSGTGAGFLRVLRFLLPNIPQISPSS